MNPVALIGVGRGEKDRIRRRLSYVECLLNNVSKLGEEAIGFAISSLAPCFCIIGPIELAKIKALFVETGDDLVLALPL